MCLPYNTCTLQVLSGIRTVASLNSEEIEIKRYSGHLDGAYKAGIREGISKGLGNGMLFTCFYFSYGLAFWFGTKQVRYVNSFSICSGDHREETVDFLFFVS